ncbi:HAD-IG family 5'-nucleotidase [Legionella sp. CNM-4043-24]|uniref:HAD-IG family 5'-nucleotidase n=1 Tax=Legionella sp. CNM-4043-24 TaxID=3421646 RepID=UPI00403B36D0
MTQKVFVNRILNMKKIKWIGFDMDHTLIRYNTRNFEGLVYRLVVENLIESKQYPDALRQFSFNFDDTIRGLIVDSKNGNVLKLSRYGAIRLSYHGTQKIEYARQKKIYRSMYVDLKDPNFMAIDTSFSIAFCVLYSQIIDYKDQYPGDLPDYATIAKDVLASVDRVHADGSLKSIISENLEQFVLRDEQLVKGLKRYLHYGKKLFVLTNSDFFYTKLLLDYAINPYLENGETWRDLFDYVITLASKPRFFYDNPRFLRINPEDGSMTNTRDKITPGIYQGGCARKFTDDLGINGDEILYIGDHIYGDILRLKKDCNWRTALVVEELGDEIASQIRALPVERKIVDAMELKSVYEQRYIDLCSRKLEKGVDDSDSEIAQCQQQIAAIDADLMKLLEEQQSFFNPRWGRVFRAGAEESYFAYQVDRFACIYMEKLVDLLENSPMRYFRANRRALAHDVVL